jgi:hypothetical protein
MPGAWVPGRSCGGSLGHPFEMPGVHEYHTGCLLG